MSAFTQPLDIVNRALQILELPRIATLKDSNLAATEMNFAYDKRREYELRRNLWRFATRRVALRPSASTSVLLVPSTWVPGSYAGGSIVADSAGVVWISFRNNNTGTPGLPGSGWEQYFGPMVITPWNQPAPPSNLGSNPYVTPPGVQLGSQSGLVSYFQGELVYLPDGKGGVTLFQSLMPAFLPTTPDGPLQVDLWQPGITYSKGQIAFIYVDANGQIILGLPPGLNVGGLSSNAFQSTIDFNTGNEPDLCETNAVQSQPWSSSHTYNVGDIIAGSDTQLYQSLVGSNLNVNPVADTLFAAWTPLGMFAKTWTTAISPTPRAISNEWQLIPGATASMVIPYPLTAGPLDHTSSRNAYRLPAGFLREAPMDPTLGGTPWLGAPVYESVDNDWTYESDFIVTRNNQPFIYRFVANTTDVARMDPMFCEGLAASLAIATAGTLKPDNNNVAVKAQKAYDRTMFEARTVNAIEIGGVKPPVSDYLLVRL
jgi:hypothetical protein